MKKKTVVMKTKRLTLTPLSPEELRERTASESDPHMAEALGEMLSGCEEHPESYLWYTEWRIAQKDGTPIGSLGFRGEAENGAVEIGYGIDEPYRGKGYATEAVRCAVDWALSQEGCYFVTAETEEDNAASQAVLTKLGFKRTERRGEEGPIFEKERAASAWMSVYMCLGMSVGLCFGTASDNMAIGLSIGMAIGVAVGVSMDSADKKKRAALYEARGMKNTEDGGADD